MRTSTVIFITSLATLPFSRAAPGDLDPSVGESGSGIFGQSVNGVSEPFDPFLVLQPDGRIVSAVGNRVLRLLPDGKLDSDFNSAGSISLPFWNAKIRALRVQADGKVLVGSYTGAQPELRRWNSNGTPDTSFNGTGLVALPSYPNDLAVDEKGRILVAMSSGLGRYTPAGELDGTFGNAGVAFFRPAAPVVINSVVPLPDGNLIVAVGWGGLQKLNSSGAVESEFDAPAVSSNGTIKFEIVDDRVVFASYGCLKKIDFNGSLIESICEGNGAGMGEFAFQRDGKPVLVGRGNAVYRLLANGDDDKDFADGGTKIVYYGNILSAPRRVALQRDGKIVVAAISGSNLLVIRLLGDDPDIAVEYPKGSSLSAVPAPTIDFGPVVAGQSRSRTVYLSNRSPADLERLKVVRGTSGTPSDFTVVSEIPATLAYGESVPLTVVLTPSAPGQKSATLEIQSNDPDESPFTLSLAGRQATASDLWRQTYFGSMDGSGEAADQSDPDADGISNLMEFALGSHPKESTPAPGTIVKNGSTLEFSYWRSKAALSDVTFVREFSQSLSEGWSQIGGMSETVAEETAELQRVVVTTPAGTSGRRFVRLRVTRR